MALAERHHMSYKLYNRKLIRYFFKPFSGYTFKAQCQANIGI